MEPDIVECCKTLNPCDAVCLLENVMVDLAVGRFVTAYKVGDESYSFAKPAMEDVKRLLEFFQKKCNLAAGKRSRARAKVCFVFGDHTCPSCHQSSCRCR